MSTDPPKLQDPNDKKAERNRWIIQIVMVVGFFLPIVIYLIFK